MAKVAALRAAELTGVSKSTIQRAMNTGKLSFEVDNGRRLIDVSELERVFGLLPQGGSAQAGESSAQNASQFEAQMELERAKFALETERLTMKARMYEDQVEDLRRQLDDMRAQRDLWQRQAQQVLLTSQHSQKQADERIAEIQAREEARSKALNELKARQQAAAQKQAQQQQQNTMVKKVSATNQNASGGFFGGLFGSKKKSTAA